MDGHPGNGRLSNISGCTGLLSIWFGYSCFHYSISYERNAMGNKLTPVAVWGYVVVVAIIQVVLVSYQSLSSSLLNPVIITLAFSQAAIIVMFGLQIWYEKPFIILAVASAFFSALAITLALGSIAHRANGIKIYVWCRKSHLMTKCKGL